MRLYIVLICIAITSVAGVLALATSASFVSLLVWTSFAAVVVVLIDGLTATVCRLLPKKLANHEKKIFQVSANEKKFYEKLHIRKWKDKIPEIGHFTGFRKSKLEDPKNIEYLDRFLLEICYGQIGHFVSLFTSFLLLLLYPLHRLWIAISLPVAFVSLLLNAPSILVLRYNSYKLKILRKSLLKKQAKAAGA